MIYEKIFTGNLGHFVNIGNIHFISVILKILHIFTTNINSLEHQLSSFKLTSVTSVKHTKNFNIADTCLVNK